MKICHEHSRLTLNSTSDYRRLVVGAMCLDCYPKMQKTTKRGNITCYIILALTIFTIIALIISKNSGKSSSGDSTVENPEVYDPQA